MHTQSTFELKRDAEFARVNKLEGAGAPWVVDERDHTNGVVHECEAATKLAGIAGGTGLLHLTFSFRHAACNCSFTGRISCSTHV